MWDRLVLLVGGWGEAVGECDCERVECLGPALGVGAELAAAVVADVADCEVEDLQDGVFGWEVSFRFGDFAELVVQRFDGVGGVNDFADCRVEFEERYEPFPVPTP